MQYLRYSSLVKRSFTSLVGFLIVACTIVFLISPQRDATFVPTSSNAGSRVPWAAAIPESIWITAASCFAVILAIHLVLLILDTSLRPYTPGQGGWRSLPRHVVVGTLALLVGTGFAYVMRLGLVWYLLAQSIVD